MKVKIIVTEDNGTITENEGDAVIFWRNKEAEVTVGKISGG